jgi:hypothetical protein
VKRQPDDQPRERATHPCPNCKQSMRLVGIEDAPGIDGRTAELLTFQCRCGQVIAAMMQ